MDIQADRKRRSNLFQDFSPQLDTGEVCAAQFQNEQDEMSTSYKACTVGRVEVIDIAQMVVDTSSAKPHTAVDSSM